MKKHVKFNELALEEFRNIPSESAEKFRTLINLLETFGYLNEPDGKKLGNSGLFEMRVRIKGQWRGMYAYMKGDLIIILRIFRKTTQKTPEQELKTAKSRLKYYL